MEDRRAPGGDRRKSGVSIPKKILLVAGSFSLPIAVLAYFVVANINEFIDFARYETAGTTYQRPLAVLLREIPNHFIQRLHCSGVDCAATLSETEDKVSGAFQALATVTREYGTQLEFTHEGLKKRGREHTTPEAAAKQWKDIVAQAHSPGAEVSPDTRQAYRTLTADVRTIITHMGDTSKLILDPDLDSYYLMDVTLLALPQTQDRVAQIIASTSEIYRRGSITPDERTAVAVGAALLRESDTDRIVASARTALNEDQNFGPSGISVGEPGQDRGIWQ